MRTLNLNSNKEWVKYHQNHPEVADIPQRPEKRYVEWVDWYDFLGKEKPNYKSFVECKDVVAKLNFKSHQEYNEFLKNNDEYKFLPSYPDKVFKDEWEGWHDYLGTDDFQTRIDTFIKYFKEHAEPNPYGHPWFPSQKMVTKDGMNSGQSLHQL